MQSRGGGGTLYPTTPSTPTAPTRVHTPHPSSSIDFQLSQNTITDIRTGGVSCRFHDRLISPEWLWPSTDWQNFHGDIGGGIQYPASELGGSREEEGGSGKCCYVFIVVREGEEVKHEIGQKGRGRRWISVEIHREKVSEWERERKEHLLMTGCARPLVLKIARLFAAPTISLCQTSYPQWHRDRMFMYD